MIQIIYYNVKLAGLQMPKPFPCDSGSDFRDIRPHEKDESRFSKKKKEKKIYIIWGNSLTA